MILAILLYLIALIFLTIAVRDWWFLAPAWRWILHLAAGVCALAVAADISGIL